MSSTREFKKDSDKKSDTLKESADKKLDEFKEDVNKSDEFKAMNPREILTKFRELWRIPFMRRVTEFLDNPTEKRFDEIDYALAFQKTAIEKNIEVRKQWYNLIANLIKKNKLNTAKPPEILLLGLAYARDIGIKYSRDHALDCFTKVKEIAIKSPAPEGPILGIALNYSGWMHANPEGLNDRPAGMDLFREAITKGSVDAFSSLGFYSTVQDDRQHFYQRGANKSNAACCLHMGKVFYNKNSFQEAYYYFTKAAIQGRDDAIFNLGFMHDKGKYVTQDLNQAILFYRIAFTMPSRENRIREILASNKDNFFVRYQVAMLENSKTDLSKLADENPSEFLECMVNSDDLWDEVEPLLTKKVSEKIKMLLVDGISFLRGKLSADIIGIQLDYFLPKGLTKTVIALESKNHLSELDKLKKLEKAKAAEITNLERLKAEEIERCRLERERFKESVAAYKQIQDAKIKAADAERKKDAWLYSQSDSSDDPGTELITRRVR